MLKNVVLPAPFGPMIETIERSGNVNVTSLTAVRPPNCFVIVARRQDRRVATATGGGVGALGRAHARAV